MKTSKSGLIYALVNVVGLPGAGTLLAGHKVTGWCQVGLSLSLMAGTLIGLIRLVQLLWAKASSSAGEYSLSSLSSGLVLETPAEWSALGLSVGCALLYFGNLAWSLATARPRPVHPPSLPVQPPGGS